MSAGASSASTSRSLLARVLDREPAAWERLVSLYAPLVLHWCRRHELQDSDAADIFQEVFQAVAQHIGGFRKQGSHGTFRGWLRTITENKICDLFRRRGREAQAAGGTEAQQRLADVPALEPHEIEPATDEALTSALFHRSLELIRDEFEERTWQAFWQTAVDGRLPRDVGADLAMSPGAVRVAKSRVLKRLREELGDLVE